jgi:O-acetyl-ADP-ribose deacetylase (regulator of RNase III)
MIEQATGDILEAQADALVNTVNCVGVMGRGIALQFKKAYPDNARAYAAACARAQVHPGKMLVHDLGCLTAPRYIVNFPTKRHWKGKSRLEDIESGLLALVEEVRARNIRSIAVPPLGAGLGGLEWSQVRPLVVKAFEALPGVRVLLYEPLGAPPPERMVRATTRPRMTLAPAVLIGLMDRYLAAAMDPFVTLLEAHKLMYFAQSAGEPLNLAFTKGPYGPYAENLRHVLNRIEGHYVTGYGDAADRPDTALELLPGAQQAAATFLEGQAAARERFDRVTDLIAGFETPFGMELLTTVYWVLVQEGVSVDEVVARVHGWNARKRMFTAEQVAMTVAALDQRGWLPRQPASPPAHSPQARKKTP